MPVLDLADLWGPLCCVTPDRRPGCAGNQEAGDLVCSLLADLGWQVEAPEFPSSAGRAGRVS